VESIRDVLESLRSRGLVRPCRLDEVSTDSLGFFIRLPASAAKQFPKDRGEGEDDSPPHVTALYVGPTHPADVQACVAAARLVCETAAPLEMHLGGVAWFTNQHGQEIAHSIVECVDLRKLHAAVREAVAGVTAVNDFPAEYTPHATLAYCKSRRYDGPVPQASFTVKEIEVWYGGRCDDPVARLPLSGKRRDG
jgi:2'-5' RNA ligase